MYTETQEYLEIRVYTKNLSHVQSVKNIFQIMQQGLLGVLLTSSTSQTIRLFVAVTP
jgi:hypothetical protein